MRLLFLFGAACCSFLGWTTCAATLPQSEPGEPAIDLRYEVTKSSGHFNIWTAQEILIDPETGETNKIDHQVVQLGSGLNYFDDVTQAWQPSVPQFDLDDQGVSATRVFHQVHLASDPAQRSEFKKMTEPLKQHHTASNSFWLSVIPASRRTRLAELAPVARTCGLSVCSFPPARLRSNVGR